MNDEDIKRTLRIYLIPMTSSFIGEESKRVRMQSLNQKNNTLFIRYIMFRFHIIAFIDRNIGYINYAQI